MPLYSMLQDHFGVIVDRSRENISACHAGAVIGKS